MCEIQVTAEEFNSIIKKYTTDFYDWFFGRGEYQKEEELEKEVA